MNTPSVTSHCGVAVPCLIYGTAWKQERTQPLVEQALRHGFRGIDTACQPKHYHEPGVGAALAAWLAEGGTREEIYLQTKFTPVDGQDPRRIPYDPAASLRQQVEQSYQASLRNLQTGYLDGLVLHSPLPTHAQLMEVWSAMEALIGAGGVRQLGISNCYDPAELDFLYRHATVKPAVVQNRFYAATGYDREIRGFCRERGILYQSFWTLTANDWLLHHPRLEALSGRFGCGTAQILFRYLSQCGVIPLTGTSSTVHMAEDLAIFDFALSDEDLAAVSQLLEA